MQRWPPGALVLVFGPVKEVAPSSGSGSAFLTESPISLVINNKDSAQKDKEVPWLVGTTEDEGCSLYAGLVLQDENMVNEINLKWEETILRTLELDKYIVPEERGAAAEKIRQFYFGGDKKVGLETREAFTNLYSDGYFGYGARKSAIMTASSKEEKKNQIYLYRYSHQGPASLMNLFGFPLADVELKSMKKNDK